MSDFKRFRYSMQIKEHHLDTFSHVNNATYLEIFEEARWELLELTGYGLNTIHATKIGPVVLECHIKFLKELRLRQTIIIESQIQSYERVTGTIEQLILDEANQQYCKATFIFGLFDLEARKLMAPPEKWIAAMSS